MTFFLISDTASVVSYKQERECLYTIYIKDTKKQGQQIKWPAIHSPRNKRKTYSKTEVSPQMQEDPVNMIASCKKEFPSSSCFLLWTNNP
jgi:hypothetical protein